jgi:hypothetical protein
MNSLARVLAVLLSLVLVDALAGFRLYQRLVAAAVGAWCKLTNRDDYERMRCASSIFYSKGLWLLISALMGVASGYVALEGVTTRRW